MRQPRRPMTRQELLERQEREQMPRWKRRQQSRELARGPIDLPFCLLALLLTAVGLVMLLSASFPSAYYENGDPTALFCPAGRFLPSWALPPCSLSASINYQRFRGAGKGAAAAFHRAAGSGADSRQSAGRTSNNATRWLGVGESFSFQPSEIAKVAVVVYFADSISRKKDKMQTFRYGILPYAFLLVVTGGAGGRGAPPLRRAADSGRRRSA